MTEQLVVDSSAIVDLSLGGSRGEAVRRRFSEQKLHAPAHFDAEALSALGRLQRAGHIGEDDVLRGLNDVTAAPIERHLLPSLVTGAWHRRHNFRLVDALYVELALKLQVPLITTDKKLANATGVAEFITE